MEKVHQSSLKTTSLQLCYQLLGLLYVPFSCLLASIHKCKWNELLNPLLRWPHPSYQQQLLELDVYRCDGNIFAPLKHCYYETIDVGMTKYSPHHLLLGSVACLAGLLGMRFFVPPVCEWVSMTTMFLHTEPKF